MLLPHARLMPLPLRRHAADAAMRCDADAIAFEITPLRLFTPPVFHYASYAIAAAASMPLSCHATFSPSYLMPRHDTPHFHAIIYADMLYCLMIFFFFFLSVFSPGFFAIYATSAYVITPYIFAAFITLFLCYGHVTDAATLTILLTPRCHFLFHEAPLR